MSMNVASSDIYEKPVSAISLITDSDPSRHRLLGADRRQALTLAECRFSFIIAAWYAAIARLRDCIAFMTAAAGII